MLDACSREARPPAPSIDGDSPIAFVHIPKTGGTTLNSLLAREYGPGETCMLMMRGMSLRVSGVRLLPRPAISFSKLRRLKSGFWRPHAPRLIHGHFDLSIAGSFPANTRFITLLRDPVERAISHYYHYRRLTADPIHPLALRSTLAEWVSACGLVEMDNGQTRRLAGEFNVRCGRVTPRTLDVAKSNLVSKIAVFGLTERFDESMALFRHAFNWPRHRFTALNVGDDRPRQAEVGEETLAAIRNRNRFDLELYQFACECFERALREIT